MKLISGMVLLAGLFADDTDFITRKAAMLVTRAEIYNINGGRVVKSFPNVMVSRHEVDSSQSYFILDSDDLDNTMVRSLVTYSMGENKNEPDTFKMTVDPKDFIQKLRVLGIKLPETLHLTADLNDIALSSNNQDDGNESFPRRSWYVLRGKEPEKTDDEDGKRIRGEMPSMRSIMIEFEPRKDLEAELNFFKQEGGAGKIYDLHFTRLPLKIEIRRSLPNGKSFSYPEAEGFYFAKHRAQGSGFLIAFGKAPNDPATDALYLVVADRFEKNNEAYEFQVDAAPFIQHVIGSVLGGDEGHVPPLECLIPSEESEAARTACKRLKEENGPERIAISGTLDPKMSDKKVEFWLKSKINPTESYKCSLGLGAENSLPEVGAGTQVIVVSDKSLSSSEPKQ